MRSRRTSWRDDQSRHNYEAYKHLATERGHYRDWAITTLFYSVLQLVDHHAVLAGKSHRAHMTRRQWVDDHLKPTRKTTKNWSLSAKAPDTGSRTAESPLPPSKRPSNSTRQSQGGYVTYASRIRDAEPLPSRVLRWRATVRAAFPATTPCAARSPASGLEESSHGATRRWTPR